MTKQTKYHQKDKKLTKKRGMNEKVEGAKVSRGESARRGEGEKDHPDFLRGK